MYVCLCHGITHKDVLNSISSGNDTFCHLMDDINVAKTCAKCVPQLMVILNQEQLEKNILFKELKADDNNGSL